MKRRFIEKSKLNSYKQNRRRGYKVNADNLAELLAEYVELYGQAHWSYSTYTNHVALIRNHILPAFGDMKLTEFSPKNDCCTVQQDEKPAEYDTADIVLCP